MIEHPIQPNPTPKIQKNWIFNKRANAKNPIISDFQSIELLDWIGFFSVQSNPIIQQKSNKKSKNPTFLDFWSWIWLDVQSSIQSKIQKKVDFLILVLEDN
jgi:hypothetical protein